MIRAGKDFWANLSTGKWAVIVEDDKGFAIDAKCIHIQRKRVHTKDYMGTCIHECGHAIFPDMTEAQIVQLEKDITEVLWKRGYRLQEAKPNAG